MTLQSIAKDLGEIKDKLAALLTGKTADQSNSKDLASLQSELKELEVKISAELSKAQSDLAASNAKVEKLTKDLDKANADLKAEQEKSKIAGASAVAAQGLNPADLPSAQVQTKTGEGETAFGKYHRLLAEGKSREAADFYGANADKIYSSRN